MQRPLIPVKVKNEAVRTHWLNNETDYHVLLLPSGMVIFETNRIKLKRKEAAATVSRRNLQSQEKGPLIKESQYIM